jgi:O-antigen/teichoic acid export membrane protein
LSLRSNISWKAGSEVLARETQILLGLFCARILGAEGWGLYNTLFAATWVLGQLMDAGIHLALTRRVAAENDRAGRWLGTALVLKGVLTLAGAAVLVWMHVRFRGRPGASLILLFGAAQMALSYQHLLVCYFRGFQRLDHDALVSVLQRLSLASLGAAALFFWKSLAGLATCLLLSGGISLAAALWILCHRYPLPQWTDWRDRARPFARDFLPVGAALALAALYIRCDVLVLAWFLAPERVGVYSAASHALLAANVVPALAVAALFPRGAALWAGDRDAYSHLGRRALWIFFLLGAAAAAALFLLGPWILPRLFGGEYRESAGLLRGLAPAAVPMYVNYLCIHWLLAAGRSWDVTAGMLLCLALRVGLAATLVPALDVWGACGAVVGSELGMGFYLLLQGRSAEKVAAGKAVPA